MMSKKVSIQGQTVTAFLSRFRFSLLFGSLLMTLGGFALLADLGPPWALFLLLVLDFLVLFVVITGRLLLRMALALFALSLISWVLSTWMPLSVFKPGSELSAALLLMLGTSACFRAAFSRGPVDRERLAAALSFYLLLGLIFSLLFGVISAEMPGSFHFSAPRTVNPAARPLFDMVYFSFVTLATLGYGDVVPVGAAAKGLAILEAILGQMYLVVVVARLVSLYGQSESK